MNNNTGMWQQLPLDFQDNSTMNSSGTISVTNTGTNSGYITYPGITTGGLWGVNNLDNMVIHSNTMNKSPLHVTGDANIDGTLKAGEIEIDGQKLSERLKKLEEHVGIFAHPNKQLEQRWEQLRELGRQYRELEAEIIEKQKLWNTLRD